MLPCLKTVKINRQAQNARERETEKFYEPVAGSDNLLFQSLIFTEEDFASVWGYL